MILSKKSEGVERKYEQARFWKEGCFDSTATLSIIMEQSMVWNSSLNLDLNSGNKPSGWQTALSANFRHSSVHISVYCGDVAAKKNLQCTCVKTQKWMCIRNTHVKPPTDITRQMQESSACEKSSHSMHLPPILTSAALCTLGAHPFQSPRTPCLLMMLEKACEVLRTLSQ